MNCYGHYGRKRGKECAGCSEARWCKEASDVELLRDHMSSFTEELQDDEARELAEAQQSSRKRKLNGEKLEYSRNDLLEVISFMLSLDPMAWDLLNEKIHDPDITLSDIARKRHTSRQAVQQALKRKCKEVPEIARLLDNRERKSRQRKQLTFMEAVCQIRRQRSTMSLNAPASGLKFYRSLNCWNQNFDLSRMSTLKGSSILPNV